MPVISLIVAMRIVGLVVGWAAGPIWKGKRPIGVRGDYIVAVLTAIAVGLLDWFVIPAMGFSDTMKYLGVAIEPAAGALIILWIIRLAKR
jgi:uncharacterized membrane protein YeaQ/YmgE (transglycosylase-associated protein family)